MAATTRNRRGSHAYGHGHGTSTKASPPPPLTAVLWLSEAHPRLAVVSSVAALVITEFLDVASTVTLTHVAQVGSVRFLQRVLAQQHAAQAHEEGATDALLLEGQLLNAIGVAAFWGHLTLVQYIVSHCREPDMATSYLERAAEAAAEGGHLEIMQWCAQETAMGIDACVARVMYPVTRFDALRARQQELHSQAHLSSARLRVTQWLQEMQPDPLASSSLLLSAVRAGHAQAVRFLVEERGVAINPVLLSMASSSGHLQIVEYLAQQAPQACSQSVLAGVASRGRRDLLEALLTWNPALWASMGGLVDDVARSGDVSFLEWVCHQVTARASSLPTEKAVLATATRSVTFTAVAINRAASMGHLQMLQWLSEHVHDGWTTRVMDVAAGAGHLEVVQWLHRHRTEGCTSRAMDSAAEHGHRHVVEWLHTHRTEGCSTRAMDCAAFHGHLELVQWLHTHRTEGCTANAMNSAAYRGHMQVLQWLHEHRTEGCTTWAMDAASMEGHLAIVQWLHAHRSEGCTVAAIDRAAYNGHMHVVQWLVQQRFLDVVSAPSATTRMQPVGAMNTAAASGHLTIVAYLHERGVGGCTTDAMDGAARNGHLAIVKWLQHHRTEGCTAYASDDAWDHGHFGVVTFLFRHYKKTRIRTRTVGNAMMDARWYALEWLVDQWPERVRWRDVNESAMPPHPTRPGWLKDLQTRYP